PTIFHVSFLMTPFPQPKSMLFPYTTLFRSRWEVHGRRPTLQTPQTRSGQSGREPGRYVHRRGRQFDVRQRKAERVEGFALANVRSEEHTSELQSRSDLVCRLLLEKKNES